ncbi:TetR/AcrR family transcriptional regulator [Sphingopyxis panaciterrae]
MQKYGPPSKTGVTAPRARGRPRAFDRDAALDQATRLFWVKGFEATSIADLTDAMGIGAPSLYAAFGSKEALYAEALRHYGETNEHFVWSGFFRAATAREAVRSLLMDSAAALTGCLADMPRGCMVALSTVGGEDHAGLRELGRSGRAVTLERLETRLNQAIADGELPASTDVRALARFVQTIQTGMSIPARDGASRADLEAVARLAMLGWDARLAGTGGGD